MKMDPDGLIRLEVLLSPQEAEQVLIRHQMEQWKTPSERAELQAEVALLRAQLLQTYVVVRENAMAYKVTGQWDRLQAQMLQVFELLKQREMFHGEHEQTEAG